MCTSPREEELTNSFAPVLSEALCAKERPPKFLNRNRYVARVCLLSEGGSNKAFAFVELHIIYKLADLLLILLAAHEQHVV